MTARAQRRMLNEVKKNPRANISVDEFTIRKTLKNNGVHGRTPRKKPLLYKINIAARLKFAKVHMDVPQLPSKILCGQMKLQLSCLEGTHNTVCGKKRHSTPTSKTPPNCKVWWQEHHGLGMLCCLRAWTACYHRQKNEFPSLSRQFAGEC